MRSGAEYRASLDDGRVVVVVGERVVGIAAHPGFTGIVGTVAALYDYAADAANAMQYDAPETGQPANKVYLIRRTPEELRARREAIGRWARISRGFLGRSPDHVGGFLAGFASAASFFDRPERAFGDNVRRFYRRVLEEDLFVTYVIVPPQVDRSTTAQGWERPFTQVGVAAERDDGFVLRGAQQLGTCTAVSDYVFVSCIKPLQPGDEPYAVSCVVPVNAEGFRLYCRRPYAAAAPSVYDYPLSTRFDESDGLAVFDDVFVPWEQVFVNQEVAAVRDQFFTTAAHALGNSQAQIRLAEKLQFILGVTRRVAAVNRIDGFPAVQEKLSDLAARAAVIEGMVLAAESASVTDAYGVVRPHPRFLYASMSLQSEFYPHALQILRELAGGGVLQVPASFRDLADEETRADLERYVQSPDLPAEERIKLFQAGLGHRGERVRGPAPAVRDVLRGRTLHHEELSAPVRGLRGGAGERGLVSGGVRTAGRALGAGVAPPAEELGKSLVSR